MVILLFIIHLLGFGEGRGEGVKRIEEAALMRHKMTYVHDFVANWHACRNNTRRKT